MPQPPQLATFNAKEQWFYPEFPVDDQATHLISKDEPGHPSEETNFDHLYP